MQIRGIVYILLFTFSLQAESYTLADLCKKGLENNPKISSFGHRTSASGSVYDQSIDQYKPHLNLSGQFDQQNYHYGATDTGDARHYNGFSTNYKFSVKQPIYRAKLLHAITDAKEREKLAMLQEEDERAKLVVQILQVSVELAKLKQVISILKKKTSVLEKAHTHVKKRYAVKLAPQADKFQSLSILQEARSELLNAQQMYRYSLYNLRLLTKYKNVEKYLNAIDFNISAIKKAFKEVNIPKLKADIDENTRIKLDNQSMIIAKVQIGLRGSEWQPQVDAVLSYNDSDGSIDGVTREDESHAMITVNFPFYQGGYVTDRTEEAKFLFYATRDDAENSRLDIKISMEKALQNIKGGLETVKANQLAIDASKKYLDSAIMNYKSGMLSLTDTYLAEAEYRDNQLRSANNKANIYASLMEIYYYVGRSNYKGVKKLQKKFFR